MGYCDSDCEKEYMVGPMIHKLDKILYRNISAQVKAAGLDEVTLMHGWIIRYLYMRRDEEVFQKDIEKQFSICRSTVTNLIQLMEKKGFIVRESVASDARLKKVKLTEKAIENQRKMGVLGKQVDEQLIRGISEEELQIFFRVMEKIEQNVYSQMLTVSDGEGGEEC